MRTSGIVDGPAYPAVHDHLAWTGEGAAGLARTARHVFGTAQKSERLVLVSGDGSACGLEDGFAADLARGRLVTMNALETYAPVLDGGADAAAEQLGAFDTFVDDALAAGYSGLRVVADNTDMLAGTDAQARNWLAWEQLTDRWQLLRPVNGNCYFDESRIDPVRMRAARNRHSATVGAAEPWRVFFDQDDTGALHLALAGSVEAFDQDELTAALRASLDLGTHDDAPLVLSLRDTEYLHHTIPFAVSGLATHGPGLRVTDVPLTVARLLRCLPPLAGFSA